MISFDIETAAIQTYNKNDFMDYNDFITVTPEEFCVIFGCSIEPFDYLRELQLIVKIAAKINMPFVAGGHFVRLANHEDLLTGDIDFFPSDEDNLRQVSKFLDFFHIKEYDALKNNDVMFDGRKFQIIGAWAACNYLDPIRSQLSTFESYMNMIGYDHTKDLVYMHKDTVDCIAKKHYKFNTFANNRSHPMQIIKRYGKFIERGYHCDKDDLINMTRFITKNAHKLDRPDDYFNTLFN